jgi:hypothetical protein
MNHSGLKSYLTPSPVTRKRSDAFGSSKEFYTNVAPFCDKVMTFKSRLLGNSGDKEASLSPAQGKKVNGGTGAEYDLVWNRGEVHLRHGSTGEVRDIEVMDDQVFMGLCAVWGF